MWESAKKYASTTEALFLVLTVLFVTIAGLTFFLASIGSIQRENLDSIFSTVVQVENTLVGNDYGTETEAFSCELLNGFFAENIRRKRDKDGHSASEWLDVCSMESDLEAYGRGIPRESLDVLDLDTMGSIDFVRMAANSILGNVDRPFRVKGTIDGKYPVEFITSPTVFRDKLLDRAREILLQTAVVATIAAILIWLAVVQFVSKPINEIKRRIKIAGGGPQRARVAASGSVATAEIQDLVDLTNRVVPLVKAGLDTSGVWHDLKELSGIQLTSLADLGGLSGGDKLTELQRGIVSNLQNSLNRSKVVLEMLLNFSSGEVMPVKVRKLVDDVVRAAAGRELSRDLEAEFEVSIDDDPVVEIVEPSVFLALNNLVQNSQRAFAKSLGNNGSRTSRIHISVSENGHEIEIRVRDNGPGIEPERLEEMLDDELPKRDEETGGYGIGFYSAKVSVELHGGSLNLIESRHVSQYPEDSGACFSIVLPKSQNVARTSENDENPHHRHCIEQ